MNRETDNFKEITMAADGGNEKKVDDDQQSSEFVGNVRIGKGSIKIVDVVRAHNEWGMTADEIETQFPGINLSEIYAALACYHADKDRFDAYMMVEADVAGGLAGDQSKKFNQTLSRKTSGEPTFHLDRSCPEALAEALRERRIDVTTSGEVWLIRGSNREQLVYAWNVGRTILTRDLEFIESVGEYGGEHSGVIYLNPSHSIDAMAEIVRKISKYFEASQLRSRVEFV
jgi:uncharacterized protein (DUF433 family)